MPSISVIIGVYNGVRTLGEALDSIISQTYSDWEMIVCDDGSTDRTWEILEAYAQKLHGRMVLLRHEKNQGLASALNTCLSAAHGEFIARMDADDISLPERFEQQIAYLREHPEVDLVGSSIEYFDGVNTLGKRRATLHPTKFSLLRETPFCHPSVLVRRRVFEALGGYNSSALTRRCEDRDLWFRFFAAGFRGDNLPQVLFRYRNDYAAEHRRGFRERWNSYRVTLRGCRLLGFPWWRSIRPTIGLFKALIPYRLMYLYHHWAFKRG